MAGAALRILLILVEIPVAEIVPKRVLRLVLLLFLVVIAKHVFEKNSVYTRESSLK